MPSYRHCCSVLRNMKDMSYKVLELFISLTDITTIFSPEGWKYKEQTGKERKGEGGEVEGALPVRWSSRAAVGRRCQSSLGLGRAHPDTQLLLMEKMLEGQDTGEVRWRLHSPHGTGLLTSAPLVLSRTQKVLKKFVFECPQYRTPSLLYADHANICTCIAFSSICTDQNPFLSRCAFFDASYSYFLPAGEKLFRFT